jgi:hypothetical protein
MGFEVLMRNPSEAPGCGAYAFDLSDGDSQSAREESLPWTDDGGKRRNGHRATGRSKRPAARKRSRDEVRFDAPNRAFARGSRLGRSGRTHTNEGSAPRSHHGRTSHSGVNCGGAPGSLVVLRRAPGDARESGIDKYELRRFDGPAAWVGFRRRVHGYILQRVRRLRRTPERRREGRRLTAQDSRLVSTLRDYLRSLRRRKLVRLPARLSHRFIGNRLARGKQHNFFVGDQ